MYLHFSFVSTGESLLPSDNNKSKLNGKTMAKVKLVFSYFVWSTANYGFFSWNFHKGFARILLGPVNMIEAKNWEWKKKREWGRIGLEGWTEVQIDEQMYVRTVQTASAPHSEVLQFSE